MLGIGYAEKLVEERQRIIELSIETERAAGDLVAHRTVTVLLLDSEIAPHDLQHRQKRNRLPVRDAVTCKDGDSSSSATLDNS
jgi:hypothetical protein